MPGVYAETGTIADLLKHFLKLPCLFIAHTTSLLANVVSSTSNVGDSRQLVISLVG
jgi:hypothetical protein